MILARLDSQGRIKRLSVWKEEAAEPSDEEHRSGKRRDLPRQESLAEQDRVPFHLSSEGASAQGHLRRGPGRQSRPQNTCDGALIPEPLPRPRTLVTVTGTVERSDTELLPKYTGLPPGPGRHQSSVLKLGVAS